MEIFVIQKYDFREQNGLFMTFFTLTSVSFSSVFYILICGFLAVVLYLIRTACGVSQTLKKNKDGKGGNDL